MELFIVNNSMQSSTFMHCKKKRKKRRRYYRSLYIATNLTVGPTKRGFFCDLFFFFPCFTFGIFHPKLWGWGQELCIHSAMVHLINLKHKWSLCTPKSVTCLRGFSPFPVTTLFMHS